MRKIGILLLSAALFSFLFYKFTTVPALPETPGYNVLYLSADSFNKKHLAIYGYHRDTMPFLSSLAKDAAVFDQMINPSSWTNESLISIFSSLSSPVHKVETRGHSIDPRWITPIEILREYGYQVPRLGGWQGTENHSNLGFDSVTTMHPAQWLEEHGSEGPFFLFYQFLQPHLPYNGDHQDSDAFFSYFRPEVFQNEGSRKRVMSTVYENAIIENDGTVTFEPEDMEPIHALYDGELALLDREIERTVKTLEKLGLLGNTVIIVGADHGEELLEHGFVGHASTSREAHLYDEIINIPFLISFPKEIPSGRFIKTQVRGIDVMPTLLDLLEIPLPDYLEGRSLMPVIKGQESQHRVAFIQTSRAGYQEPDPENVTDRIRAVRTGTWKLIHYNYLNDPTRFELYNLTKDPFERENVVKEYPEKANELRKLLMDWTLRENKVEPPPPQRYTQKSWYQRAREYLQSRQMRSDYSGVPSPPDVISPTDGAVLTYNTWSGVAIIRWSGEADVPYVIEYEVGEETYHLTGSIRVQGNEKVFGPFPQKYWDTYLALYSPGKIRISIDKDPREWSRWVHFEMKGDGPQIH